MIKAVDQLRVFDEIQIENRLHSPVNVRTEMRAKTLVLILEPQMPEKGGLILPGIIGLPKNGGPNGG